MARIGEVQAPIDTLVNPATIASSALPWLAFGLSVDYWDVRWSEEMKRRTVAESIAQHRIKGTRASVEHVLARIDGLATVLEAHEDPTRLAPHTFEVIVPLVTEPGAAGGERTGAAIIEDIIAQVTNVKPLREHLTVIQSLMMQGGIGIQSAARLASYTREDTALVVDTSPAWDFYLQTEEGEPMQNETGSILDTAA
jgi:phage tail P2-like protein